MDADSNANKASGTVSTRPNTPLTTPNKAYVSGVCTNSADNADKNLLLEGFTVVDIKDEDLPKGFL